MVNSLLNTHFFDRCKGEISALGLSDLDSAFAHFIYQHEKHLNDKIALLAGLVSQRLSQQHSCLNLNELSYKQLKVLGFSNINELIDALNESYCVSASSNENPQKPLIFEQNAVYLQRYHQYELGLTHIIQQKLRVETNVSVEIVKPIIHELFAQPNQKTSTEQVEHSLSQVQTEIDWQKVAVGIAATRNFSLITGGPGTGKTTTVAKLLALLFALQRSDGKELKVQLVAPTGKAAARLTESIVSVGQKLPKAYQAGLDLQTSTIHRLLGTQTGKIEFKHNAENLLHMDALIVDEASMVDLPLMYKLLSAVPKQTKVILLGDHNQLSSVETGSVLSDICYAALLGKTNPEYSVHTGQQITQMCEQHIPQPTDDKVNSPIADCLVKLQKSHRFPSDSGIGLLAEKTIEGDVDGVLSVLSDSNQETLSWYQEGNINIFARQYASQLNAYFSSVKKADLKQGFVHLLNQQILCAHKSGEWGVDNINYQVTLELDRQGFISKDEKDYVGRPIMLTRNDHNLGLFNGDVGIVMPDPENPKLIKAWFKTAESGFKGVLLSRLPEHQPVYAMTIHKSQGSEFNHVYLCLPDVRLNPGAKGLSRELFYTGLTRARETFVLYSHPQSLQTCINNVCLRSSGLAQRLSD
ncbi:exodeoxyribonuclease V subunit alpha [Aliiglaciecola sp. 3_MG-2023]|uniref:exodeoxyribonuclease V subunit alpha n=1 Tax=Aliiglaciecola sp. 3_MG-2023 TaxID=3062644 RepID=UPI0026E3DBCB|nr:exodeoxyribonuclease V subunit alpha [Aliiglaciecola sp. 3_MG-2023]MDO6693374.1 exodeoxyribonuclease V subunit alpha [Aliiglaciecola sp. 3_MG-2023]